MAEQVLSDKQVQTLIKSALADLRKTEKGYQDKPIGPNWVLAEGKLKKAYAGLELKKVRVPQLGPILKGGKSVLKHDCTHYTDGIGWPAFDDMADPGHAVIAPENMVIYDNTSGAQGGDAFYCRGASGMLYWVGHISRVPSQGKFFKKGEVMTYVSGQHSHPHVHLAINSVPLIGHHLISKTDYSHGAPLIGVQLYKWLS